jgi:hypothetical protein
MRRTLVALDRAWYTPAPAERLAVVRLLVGAFALVYLLVRAPSFLDVARLPTSHFAPVGPVTFLEAPLPFAASATLLAAALPLGLAFTVGAGFRVTGPLFALLVLWLASYRSSWGMLFHTENLLCLHLLLLGAAPASDALSVDARHATRERAPHGRYGWALRAMSAVTVVAYFLAGLAKLKISGFAWAHGDVLRVHIAYDNLRKLELGSVHSPLGGWLVQAAWLFPPLALASLALELGGPLALFHRGVARVWCAGLWLFHVGVVLLMAIAFPYPLALVPFASFFETEKSFMGRWLETLFAVRSTAKEPAPEA